MTYAGHRLLTGYVAVLRRAVERYAGDDDRPEVARADVVAVMGSGPQVAALEEIILREAPYVGGGNGGAGESWSRDIRADITRYWNAVAVDGYLSIRADELRHVPHLRWQTGQRHEAHQVLPPATAPAVQPRDHRDGRRDVFISHASEDKDAVARPLAAALRAQGFSVWLDEDELVVGASLSESIDWGLRHSDHGVVVLSPAFFAKSWPRQELRGLVTRRLGDDRHRILPIYHGVDHEYVAHVSPTLGDVVAVDAADGISAVASKVSEAIGPRRARNGQPPDEASRGGSEASVPSAAASSTEPASAVTLRRELVELLRAEDRIGTEELLRSERRDFERRLPDRFGELGDELGRRADHGRLRELEVFVWACVERRLATLLPLVQYAPRRLTEDCTALAAAADRITPTRSRVPAWRDAMRWPVWMVVHAVGAFAVATEQWSAVAALWNAETRDGRPLAALRLEGAERLAYEVAHARPNVAISSRAVWMWHLAFRSAGSALVDEHYAELVSGPTDDPVGAFLSRLGDFSWLVTALAGRAGLPIDQYWRAAQVHPQLPEQFTAGSGKVGAAARVVFQTDEWSVGSEIGGWVSRADGRTDWS
jgi:hypothetical protein